MKKISYGSHYLDSKDYILINKVLKSNYLTNGPVTSLFETKLKKYFKTKFCLTVSNATAGLNLAFKAIGLEKNDAVIMPVINFISSYNMAKGLDAKIYLADVDKYSGQMRPMDVENCIRKNNLKNIKCVVSMYLGGAPENTEGFFKLKKKYKFLLIEDACHAFGSISYFNKRYIKIGSNLNSDIAVFSFHPVKAITTGEGGCLTFNNKKFYEKAMLLRNHGIKRSKNHWDYDVVANGFNYRLSDINCALGITQLNKIELFTKERNKIANEYKNKISKLSKYIILPKYKKKDYNSYHLFILIINFKKLNKNKNHLFDFMKKNGVVCQFHYKPIYKFKILNKVKLNKKNFPNAEFYSQNAISIPIFYNLSKKQQNYIFKKLNKFINMNKK